MQGKGLSLRLSLLTLVVVLIFGALGGITLARDAFDSDYDDCPARTRLDAVSGVTIDRTDNDDEVRISWDALESAQLSQLGPNGYRARLTVIVEGQSARHVALGDTSLVVDHIDFTESLTVSLALTLGDYVISDIAEADFTSGMPAPSFKAKVWVSANNIEDAADDAGTTDVDESVTSRAENRPLQDEDKDDIVLGSFYYIGFNDLFDNWYVTPPPTGLIVKPSTPKFRVGVGHGGTGLDLGEADFANYRITIEDSSGDLLGYQAETVEGKRTYGGNKIVFGAGSLTSDTNLRSGPTDGTIHVLRAEKNFTNIRLSNQVTDDGAVSPYFAPGGLRGSTTFDRPGPATEDGLSYANIWVVDAEATGATAFPATNVLYADPPVEYFDFPRDVFEADGSYTIKAWAEDDDGTRISSQTSIEISVRESEPLLADPGSSYQGYASGVAVRTWDTAVEDRALTVVGLSIQGE